MSIEVPNLPDKLDWKATRLVFIQWFSKLQNSQLFVPPGTIAIFGASTPPDGWVECDGATYDKTRFPNLQRALGTEISATQFQVPNAGAAPPVGSIWMIKV